MGLVVKRRRLFQRVSPMTSPVSYALRKEELLVITGPRFPGSVTAPKHLKRTKSFIDPFIFSRFVFLGSSGRPILNGSAEDTHPEWR